MSKFIRSSTAIKADSRVARSTRVSGFTEAELAAADWARALASETEKAFKEGVTNAEAREKVLMSSGQSMHSTRSRMTNAELRSSKLTNAEAKRGFSPTGSTRSKFSSHLSAVGSTRTRMSKAESKRSSKTDAKPRKARGLSPNSVRSALNRSLEVALPTTEEKQAGPQTVSIPLGSLPKGESIDKTLGNADFHELLEDVKKKKKEKKDKKEAKKKSKANTKAGLCPGGHHLVAYFTPDDTFACDTCGVQLPANSQMRGCRICDFDKCVGCFYSNKQKKQEKDKANESEEDLSSGEAEKRELDKQMRKDAKKMKKQAKQLKKSLGLPATALEESVQDLRSEVERGIDELIDTTMKAATSTVVSADQTVQTISAHGATPTEAPIANSAQSVKSDACPGGHHLVAYFTPDDTFACDICGVQLPANSQMRGCRICDFDKCVGCFYSNKQKKPENDKDPKGEHDSVSDPTGLLKMDDSGAASSQQTRLQALIERQRERDRERESSTPGRKIDITAAFRNLGDNHDDSSSESSSEESLNTNQMEEPQEPREDVIPQDPSNKLLDAWDLDGYKEWQQKQKAKKRQQKKRPSRSRSRRRRRKRSSKSASRESEKERRKRDEGKWDHEAFLKRSASPCRARTAGTFHDTRKEAWKSRAGGVFIAPQREARESDDNSSDAERKRPARYLYPEDFRRFRPKSPSRSPGGTEKRQRARSNSPDYTLQAEVRGEGTRSSFPGDESEEEVPKRKGKGKGKGKGIAKGEGDWTCLACGARVFASKFECFQCGELKPTGLDDKEGGKGKGMSAMPPQTETTTTTRWQL